MLIASIVTGPFQANCYVLAPREGADAVIVDPGMEALEPLGRALDKYHLTPVAMVCTHGHIDHIGDARRVGLAHGIGLWCPVDDRHLLRDPMAGLLDFAAPMLEASYGSTHLEEPEEVVDVAPNSHHEIAGFDLEFLHAPGHTPGCSLIRFTDPEHGPIVFSGDVLFAGSIGRTDMPGGDPAVMDASLREVVHPLPDPTHVLPGHGPATTMWAEHRTNPYLQF